MLSAVWSMIWQALYAVVGCVLGAIILGHSGALIGTIVGAWIGYRSVYPYNSLINQLNKLDDHQKKVLTDEIRRTVGSSNVENLLQYVSDTIFTKNLSKNISFPCLNVSGDEW